jgi:ATP synthase protein I
MLKQQLHKTRASAYYLVGSQAVLTLCITAGFGLFGFSEAAYAALLGGMVSVVPNFCFASRVFQFSGATRARQVVNQFYKGEALKWLLTFGLFAVIIPLLKPAPLPFFITYIVVTMMVWLSCFFFKK